MRSDKSELCRIWSWFRRLLLVCLDVARHKTSDEARHGNLCLVRDKDFRGADGAWAIEDDRWHKYSGPAAIPLGSQISCSLFDSTAM
jgi:hypothetical protein